MKRYLYVLFTVAMVAGMLLTACGPAATPAPTKAAETPKASEAAKPRVLVVINGVLGDKSFFDSAARGIEEAKKDFGIEAKIIEAGTDPSKWEPALIDAADSKYDIIICGTWQMKEYLENVAPKHPDKKFMIFDVSVDYSKGLKNVYSITYKQNEGSYLAGLYAGLVTKSKMEMANPQKVIGVIGGQDIPVINDFIVGYKQGAKDADPETQVIVQYAGGWNDPAKGKEISLAMYNQGADIIFNVAGGTGAGIFEAAKAQKRYAIGVDSDQALLFESSDPALTKNILTSMMKNVDNSLYRAIKLHLEGKLPYGSAEALGIKEGGVGLAKNKYYEQYTPDDIKKKIDEAEKKILDGTIKVNTVIK
ncbi:MAG: BMP family ABC transporter substrate-binding protein [Chloroflexi bacterium]|nr:BMP family ABC transporter substrate-binding protein [Chloroflexota bacterium]